MARHFPLPCLALVFGFSLACNTALADETNPGDVVEQWLSLEIQRGKLQSAWDDRKIILDQQMALLEEEGASLRKIIATHSSSASETEQERAAVLQQQSVLEDEQTRLEYALEVALHQLTRSVDRLPPPLQAAWSESLERYGNNEASLSDRLDGTLQLLTQLNEFNQRVAVHNGNLRIPTAAGETRLINVTQVYLGAARGWYVSADRSLFGYGESQPGGWRWWYNGRTRDVLGKPLDPQDVSSLIAVVQDPEKATLTGMPLRLDLVEP